MQSTLIAFEFQVLKENLSGDIFIDFNHNSGFMTT